MLIACEALVFVHSSPLTLPGLQGAYRLCNSSPAAIVRLGSAGVNGTRLTLWHFPGDSHEPVVNVLYSEAVGF